MKCVLPTGYAFFYAMQLSGGIMHLYEMILMRSDMKKVIMIVLVMSMALTAAAQSALKPEFTLRANVMMLEGTVNLTGGVRMNNNVFGAGAGWGQRFFIFGPLERPIAQRYSVFLYHRYYFPLGQKQRWSLYSDIIGGGMHIYEMSESFVPAENKVKPGDWLWYFSWQPGFTVRMWGKSNFFFGPSIGPTFGFHAGITL